MIIPYFSTVILNGVINYIDYFAASNKWRNITATIVNIPNRHRSKTATTYTYEMKTDKDTILLKSTLHYYLGDTLKLKIAGTPLGNVVAETR
jgi:hypothetical protein